MKSKTFRGKDAYDLDKQEWDWRTANPSIKIINRHLDEQLPLNSRPVKPGTTLTADDTVERKIDYED